MKALGSLALAAVLLLGAGASFAADTKDKVKDDAKDAGKTVSHGTTAVGKGGSKVYHDVAGGIHKIIAKNSKSDKTKAEHTAKAKTHFAHAAKKESQSKKELDKADKNAEKVGK